MKAMIFAAGIGTRLKPFTLCHPKALVPVKGIPMLERVIKKLQAIGINDFVINTHHFAEQVEDFLAENKGFGSSFAISHEKDLLLDTGGGLLAARTFFENENEPIILHNADILTDAPLSQLIEHHSVHPAIATLLINSRNSSRRLLFSPRDMEMQGWANTLTKETKPEGLDVSLCLLKSFCGVHAISLEIFPLLEEYSAKVVSDKVFSLTPFYIWACQKTRIQGFEPRIPFNWHDIGKPESLAKAEESLRL